MPHPYTSKLVDADAVSTTRVGIAVERGVGGGGGEGKGREGEGRLESVAMGSMSAGALLSREGGNVQLDRLLVCRGRKGVR